MGPLEVQGPVQQHITCPQNWLCFHFHAAPIDACEVIHAEMPLLSYHPTGPPRSVTQVLHCTTKAPTSQAEGIESSKK